MSRDESLLGHPDIVQVGKPLENVKRPSRLWTDENQTLFEVLSWR